MSETITKPDTSFVTRVLMGMRLEFETLIETLEQLRIMHDTLAKEHGLPPIQAAPLPVSA